MSVANLASWLVSGLTMLGAYWGVRRLDSAVTWVRARYGLAAGWGMAIGGFALILGYIGLVVWLTPVIL